MVGDAERTTYSTTRLRERKTQRHPALGAMDASDEVGAFADLGLRPDASTAEVKEAYRALGA